MRCGWQCEVCLRSPEVPIYFKIKDLLKYHWIKMTKPLIFKWKTACFPSYPPFRSFKKPKNCINHIYISRFPWCLIRASLSNLSLLLLLTSLMAQTVKQCGRPGFDPWVGKIPWRRKWQPTPELLPRKSHEWRSLVQATVHGVTKSQTRLSMSSLTHSLLLLNYILMV